MKNVFITNGKRTIEVTQKAFDVVFKYRGFKLVTENDSDDLSCKTADELDDYKTAQLKQYLDSKQIEYRARATKDELIALIVGGGNGVK